MTPRRPTSRDLQADGSAPPSADDPADENDSARSRPFRPADRASRAEARGGTDESVPGERGTAAVDRPASLQSRVSNLLAAGLMGTMALGLIGWYYAHSLSGRLAAGHAAQANAQGKATGEMLLPPLGKVAPPAAPSALSRALGPPPDVLPDQGAAASGLRPPDYGSAAYGSARAPTPEEIAQTRRLSGAVFSSSARAQTLSAESARPPAASSAEGEGDSPREARSGGDLEALLRPSATPAVRAQVLPTQALLLPKGAFIDCTLETAIDSTLPGMTTCVTATDTFGVDGQVVLLERGTKLVGETRGQVHQGSARIFVLWTEARTPTGVIVPLASPGTDELGRSGVPGSVNRHFWERFGAAILISTINGAIQGGVESQHSGGGTVIYNPSASQDIMTEVLKSTVSIPPTVVKSQGDRIQVLVARDLDFRSVYALRVSHGR